jgi:hypothetical protein
VDIVWVGHSVLHAFGRVHGHATQPTADANRVDLNKLERELVVNLENKYNPTKCMTMCCTRV